MSRKMSAEQAAEEGVIVGTPYTPPGRSAVFDVPSYDDIADLQLLFKRFANTTAAYSEAGGNVVAKSDSFTINPADVGSIFMCMFGSLETATLSALISPTDGMRVSLVQLGVGAAQFLSAGAPIKGITQTPAQYQGIEAIYSGGTWWCVPFGGNGGGPSGPVPVFPVTADTTLKADYIGGVVAVDVSDNKDKTITVPADDGKIPIGSIIVVSNVGPLSVPKVNLVGADGVILQDRALATINRWRSAALIKRQANLWLISAGSGGGQSGSVPTPPVITNALGTFEAIHLEWNLPIDDGGHSITAHVVEATTDGFKWDPVWSFPATKTSGDVPDLTAGVEYTLRMRSENVIGLSDASNEVKAVPTQSFNDASGGDESTYQKDGKTFRRHVFTKDGTFTVKTAVDPFNIFVAGGGGGGGVDWGSGGGGGGAVYGTLSAVDIQPNAYVIKVGSGGATSQSGGVSSVTLLGGVISANGGGGGGTKAGRTGGGGAKTGGYQDLTAVTGGTGGGEGPEWGQGGFSADPYGTGAEGWCGGGGSGTSVASGGGPGVNGGGNGGGYSGQGAGENGGAGVRGGGGGGSSIYAYTGGTGGNGVVVFSYEIGA